MTFSEQLNEYLSILNCSAKELSQISGLSNSVISRYRSGERVPRPESEKLNQLCEGIYLLSKEKAASMRTPAPSMSKSVLLQDAPYQPSCLFQ